MNSAGVRDRVTGRVLKESGGGSLRLRIRWFDKNSFAVKLYDNTYKQTCYQRKRIPLDIKDLIDGQFNGCYICGNIHNDHATFYCFATETFDGLEKAIEQMIEFNDCSPDSSCCHE